MTTYTAVLSGNSWDQNPTAEFATIFDCIKYAEAYGEPADRCDIYNDYGNRVAQYCRPDPGTYPHSIGVWVNRKIYQPTAT